MLWASEVMSDIHRRLRQLAAWDVNVLLSGEIGVGKGTLARLLHEFSPRSQGPFLRIDCPTVPENLFESTLFGREKGAFVGTERTLSGRLETANGGTVFLDNVSEIGLDQQASLLRFVEEHAFERIGGTETIRCDVRIVAATTRDLSALVAESRFLRSLYYHLAVHHIATPPLRERKEDIPVLLQHFLDRKSQQFGRRPLTVSADALRRTVEYLWPGNVKELENFAERMALKVDGDVISVADLAGEPIVAATAASRMTLDEAVERARQSHLLATLVLVEWNKELAAGMLGISVRHLARLIAQYGLDRRR